MSKDDLQRQDSWLIGRGEDCDLVVHERTVSTIHCRLTRQGEQFTLEDLDSTNGTFVDGVKIAPGQPLQVAQGAHITLGSHAQMPWPPAPDAASSVRRPVTVPSLPPLSAQQPSPGGARQITIGRSPESDVQIDLPIISWNHAVILWENGQYILEDRNSRNGTSINELNNRIQRAVLTPDDELFLGSYKIAAAQLLSRGKRIEIGESAFEKVTFPANQTQMEIGRDPECDLPLSYPMISWRHARLTRATEGILVEDLASRNGTYVDGMRISGRVLVKPGQEIGLGSFRFQLLEGGQLAQREYYGNVTIEAKEIVVCTPNGRQRLLDPVSLTVFPSELVALMGPAGAGKTTLLKALNGYTRPVEGSVLFNGIDLYRFYDRFRQQMGYVPQDDIVHPQLTVRQALYFSARLRTDLTDAEIARRTEEVLNNLELIERIDTPIGSPERKTLSGGQRKRVNIGLELITDTPVLFLDEPTSGLSSYDAESVVDLLKALSKTGKTILTTIHQPSLKVYKQFDDLIMVSRDKGAPGAMVYFGPAYPDSIQFFNPPSMAAPAAATGQQLHSELNPEMLFDGLNTKTIPEGKRTESWRQRYLASRYQREFVAGRSGKQPESRGKTGEERPRRQFGLMQWFALVRRNLNVKLRDRAQTAILLAQAPLFAVLVVLVNYPLNAASDSARDFGDLAQKLPIVHFLMVIAAIWFGCNNAARDIVGEWTIYKRERMVTLKLIPYLFSKLAVLLALSAFQCASLLGIVYLACGLHSNFFYDFLVLLLASMIGAGLGLCISAVSKTNESAIALLPVVLLPIIALGGGMRPIYLMPKTGQFISLVVPSRWAFEANLVREAEAAAWGAKKLLPDYNCNLEPEQPAPGLTPAKPQPSPNATRAKAPAPVKEATAAAPDPNDANPTLDLKGDAAEGSIPQYLLTFTDAQGVQRTCRASEDGHYPRLNPSAHAVRFRHSFRDSMVVLGTMLVLLIGAVIVILRLRDRDPQ